MSHRLDHVENGITICVLVPALYVASYDMCGCVFLLFVLTVLSLRRYRKKESRRRD